MSSKYTLNLSCGLDAINIQSDSQVKANGDIGKWTKFMDSRSKLESKICRGTIAAISIMKCMKKYRQNSENIGKSLSFGVKSG